MSDFKLFVLSVNNTLGNLLVNTAVAQMEEISYGKQHPNLPNVSSKWGDSPNNQSGDYSRSIRFYNTGNKLTFGAGYLNRVRYVSLLETYYHRPNITKAAKKCNKELPNIVREKLVNFNYFLPKKSWFVKI